MRHFAFCVLTMVINKPPTGVSSSEIKEENASNYHKPISYTDDKIFWEDTSKINNSFCCSLDNPDVLAMRTKWND